jgi:hypothetical protein
MNNTTKAQYASELSAHRIARQAGDQSTAWHHLERAHIIGQQDFFLHIDSHVKMLGHAIALRDGTEIFGQVVRLALAPLGNLTGRLPIGNTGRSNVSAFRSMDIPADLKSKLEK